MNKVKSLLIKAVLIFATALFAFGCSPAVKREISQDPWPFYQGNITHQGYVKGKVVPSLKNRWVESLKEGGNPSAPQEYSSPAAAKEKIFSYNGPICVS